LKNKIKQFGNEKTRDSPFLQGDNKENGWFWLDFVNFLKILEDNAKREHKK
jgi:hypothetical protein